MKTTPEPIDQLELLPYQADFAANPSRFKIGLTSSSEFTGFAFAFLPKHDSICALMTKPLALLFYERLMPGSQLANRLEDLGYRVQTVTEGSLLVETAQREKPLVAIIDLVVRRANVCALINDLRKGEETRHIPVIGFAAQKEKKLHEEATRCGATLVAFDNALLPQLPHLLEHALAVE